MARLPFSLKHAIQTHPTERAILLEREKDPPPLSDLFLKSDLTCQVARHGAVADEEVVLLVFVFLPHREPLQDVRHLYKDRESVSLHNKHQGIVDWNVVKAKEYTKVSHLK